MIVSCPHCTARYDVDGASIGIGRNLRCAECGLSWWQEPREQTKEGTAPIDEDETGAVGGQDARDQSGVIQDTTVIPPLEDRRDDPAEIPPAGYQPETDDEEENDPRPRGRAWAYNVLALLFCMLCAGSVAYLTHTGALWPREMVSPVISVVSTDNDPDGRSVRLVMHIANPTTEVVPVPDIAISVDDARGRETSQRRIPSPTGTLRARGTVEASVTVPRVERGSTMRVGFARD